MRIKLKLIEAKDNLIMITLFELHLPSNTTSRFELR